MRQSIGPQLVHYLDTYGRHKVLFGTDWPVIDPSALSPKSTRSDFDRRSKAMLMRDNALRVFRLPESPGSKPAAKNKPAR